MIIGLAPLSEAKYQEAQRIAENIRTDAVEVVFLDKDPVWADALTLSTAEVSPAVRLPFDQESVSPKAANSTQETARPHRPPALTLRDLWVLLILILLFLSVRSHFIRTNPSHEPTAPTQPEVTVP